MPQINATLIANRVCQKVGAELIAPGALLTEDSKQAQQISACYDLIRRAELRRNVWVFGIRVTALRPVGLTTKRLTFGTWVMGTSYAQNDIIEDPADGQLYFSKAAGNAGNIPSASPSKWTLYFGPRTATEFITTWATGYTYSLYDHAVGSDGNSYISLVDNNIANNPVGDGAVHWAVDSSNQAMATNVTFFAGELVHIGTTVYLSLTNNNGQGTVNQVPQNFLAGLPPPSLTWLSLTTPPTVAPVNFNYPIGAGPAQDFMTKNVYFLPANFLRDAPQDPKAGGALYLGAPDGSTFEDWNYQSDFFVSTDNGVIPFRFMADIQDPNQFDPMFIEGFVCRMGIEVCEPLTQSTSKINGLAAQYKQFMSEARLLNAILDGPVYPPEDSYITTRT